MVHVKNSVTVFIPIASQVVASYELIANTGVIVSAVVKAAVNCLQSIYHRKDEATLNDLQFKWVVLNKDCNEALYDLVMAIYSLTSILGVFRYYKFFSDEHNAAEITNLINQGDALALQINRGWSALAKYEEASKLGSIDADVKLAYYLMNDPLLADRARGLKLLKRAAEYGNVKAQYRLASYFEDQAKQDVVQGRSQTENQRLRIYWLKQAAFQGVGIAQFDLSILYLSDPNKNDDLAFYWSKMASDKSDEGRFNYATDLFVKASANGAKAEDIAKWRREGQKLMLEAANNGYAPAQYGIGWYLEGNLHGYKEGAGETEKARYWYEKAAALGDQDALNAIARLDAPQQQPQAQDGDEGQRQRCIIC